MTDLRGRTVIVTGAASGIGAATVLSAQKCGANVRGLDLVSGFDITEPDHWATLVRDIRSPVHGVVNCAGTTWRSRLHEATAADMARVYAVNVIGPMLGIQALCPIMPTGGSIVNIGSLAATTAHYPIAYTTSKWSLRGLTRTAAMELGPRGIRVNIVHPGFIETAMTASAPDTFRRSSIAETPLGRVGNSDEVARVVTFLLSEDASFVTGAEIPVDGGASSHGGVKSISDSLNI